MKVFVCLQENSEKKELDLFIDERDGFGNLNDLINRRLSKTNYQEKENTFLIEQFPILPKYLNNNKLKGIITCQAQELFKQVKTILQEYYSNVGDLIKDYLGSFF